MNWAVMKEKSRDLLGIQVTRITWTAKYIARLYYKFDSGNTQESSPMANRILSTRKSELTECKSLQGIHTVEDRQSQHRQCPVLDSGSITFFEVELLLVSSCLYTARIGDILLKQSS